MNYRQSPEYKALTEADEPKFWLVESYTHGWPIAWGLAYNGYDVLNTAQFNEDGTPDWSNAGMCDPRGCDTEAEWQHCERIGNTLRAQAESLIGLK